MSAPAIDAMLDGTVGAWGYIGVVPVLTAFVGFCPAYSLMGLNTCAVSDRKA